MADSTDGAQLDIGQMKVFVSWSGDFSREVALLLREYLPQIIQGLGVFMSEQDIASGARWSHELARELDRSNFGIVCLTPENRASEWILFEAGALTKRLEGRACCLLLRGLRATDVTGPLGQFQHKLFDEAGLGNVVGDINKVIVGGPSPDVLRKSFTKWWPDIDQHYQELLAQVPAESKKGPRRGMESMLEEILQRVRGLEEERDFSGPTGPGGPTGPESVRSAEIMGIEDILYQVNRLLSSGAPTMAGTAHNLLNEVKLRIGDLHPKVPTETFLELSGRERMLLREMRDALRRFESEAVDDTHVGEPPTPIDPSHQPGRPGPP